MQTFSEDDVMEYVAGGLSREQSRELELRAQSDPELSATIGLLAAIAGKRHLVCNPIRGRSATGNMSLLKRIASAIRRHRKAAAAMSAAVFILATGLAWATFHDPPLLQDSFDDHWFDPRIWQAPERLSKEMGVREEAGYLRLLNRGCIVTRAEFSKPISIEFDWNWIDLASDPLYADHLSVVLRTTGARRQQHSYEMLDGINICFNAWGGSFSIESQADSKVLLMTSAGALPLPADQWLRIRITDDGDTIHVYAGNRDEWEKHSKTPIASVQNTAQPAGHYIAISNREFVGGAPHESRIDNFSIRQFANAATRK